MRSISSFDGCSILTHFRSGSLSKSGRPKLYNKSKGSIQHSHFQQTRQLPSKYWYTVKTSLCFRYEAKTGEEFFFNKISLGIAISMESSRQDLLIDMVVDRFIFENNQITLCLTPSYPKQGVGLPKTGIRFY